MLYCKPHYEQLFKATGSYQKSFDSAIKNEAASAPSPAAQVEAGGVAKDRRTPAEKASWPGLGLGLGLGRFFRN